MFGNIRNRMNLDFARQYPFLFLGAINRDVKHRRKETALFHRHPQFEGIDGNHTGFFLGPVNYRRYPACTTFSPGGPLTSPFPRHGRERKYFSHLNSPFGLQDASSRGGDVTRMALYAL